MYNRNAMTPDPRVARAVEMLREEYGAQARAVARAPGRLEIFGAHTDYNEGYVAAIAIEQAAVVATYRSYRLQ